MRFDDFKKVVGKNKNHTVVRIRSVHYCKKCNKVQLAGSECLTVNPKFGSRFWVCKDCVVRFLKWKEAELRYNLVPFDDEGCAMAMHEYLDECKADYIYNGED